jgi:hypothetical protein
VVELAAEQAKSCPAEAIRRSLRTQYRQEDWAFACWIRQRSGVMGALLRGLRDKRKRVSMGRHLPVAILLSPLLLSLVVACAVTSSAA